MGIGRIAGCGCLVVGLGLALVALAALSWVLVRGPQHVVNRAKGQATVRDRLHDYGPESRPRLRARLEAAGVEAYPPARLVLVGLKAERRLELYAAASRQGPLRYVDSVPVLGASGRLGPKLERGDRQVPEGIYGVDFLHPNSRHHVSFRLDYPHAADRRQAARDGRSDLGGDIFVHGGSSSIGCLAIGDRPAQDLWVLVADVGIEDVEVIVSPVDFRRHNTGRWPAALRRQPDWVQQRYHRIARRLEDLPPRRAP